MVSPRKPVKEPLPPEETIGRLLKRAQHLYMSRTTALMARRGHESPGMAGMALLHYLEPEGSRPTTLAERVGMTKQAAGQTLTELETRGLVARRPDAHDGRAFLVCLTDAGKRYLTQLQEVKAEVEQEFAACVGTRGVNDLRRLLLELVSKLPSDDR